MSSFDANTAAGKRVFPGTGCPTDSHGVGVSADDIDNAKRKRLLMLASAERRLNGASSNSNNNISNSTPASSAFSAAPSTATPAEPASAYALSAVDLLVTDDDLTDEEGEATEPPGPVAAVRVPRDSPEAHSPVIDLTSKNDGAQRRCPARTPQRQPSSSSSASAASGTVRAHEARSGSRSRAGGGGPSVHESARKGRLAFYLNRLPGVQDSVSVRVADIVQPQHPLLQSVYMFNYLFDIDWIFQELPGLGNVPTRLIQHAKMPYRGEGTTSEEFRAHAAAYRQTYPWLSLTACRPSEMYGTHHSKIIICKYTSGLRVCVGTANMVVTDWYQMNNAFYVQDFPPKDAASLPSSRFADDLVAYMRATRDSCDDKDCITELITLIREYDMSGATAMLVGSVPGRHKSADTMAANGLVRLGKCVADSVAPPDAPLVVNIISISLPHDNGKWVQEELCGLLAPGMTADKLRLLWPTRQQVESSKHPNSGASVCYAANKAEKDNYLRPRFMYRYDTTAYGRGSYLAHMKSIARVYPHDPNKLYWVYIGSHNLSRAAFGNFQVRRTQTHVRSFELGVVFTPTSYDPLHRHIGFTCTPESPLPGQTIQPSSAQVDLQVLAGDAVAMQENVLYFPIPHSLTPSKYSHADVPWYWYHGWELIMKQIVTERVLSSLNGQR